MDNPYESAFNQQNIKNLKAEGQALRAEVRVKAAEQKARRAELFERAQAQAQAQQKATSHEQKMASIEDVLKHPNSTADDFLASVENTIDPDAIIKNIEARSPSRAPPPAPTPSKAKIATTPTTVKGKGKGKEPEITITEPPIQETESPFLKRLKLKVAETRSTQEANELTNRHVKALAEKLAKKLAEVDEEEIIENKREEILQRGFPVFDPDASPLSPLELRVRTQDQKRREAERRSAAESEAQAQAKAQAAAQNAEEDETTSPYFQSRGRSRTRRSSHSKSEVRAEEPERSPIKPRDNHSLFYASSGELRSFSALIARLPHVPDRGITDLTDLRHVMHLLNAIENVFPTTNHGMPLPHHASQTSAGPKKRKDKVIRGKETLLRLRLAELQDWGIHGVCACGTQRCVCREHYGLPQKVEWDNLDGDMSEDWDDDDLI